MSEGVLEARVVHPPDQVHIEKVFPRFAAQRAGLDLRQVEIPQSERAQGAKQRTGRIPSRENNGRFVFLGRILGLDLRARPGEQKKPRVVVAVVFNAAPVWSNHTRMALPSRVTWRKSGPE